MVMEMIGNEIYVNLILEDLPRPYRQSGIRGWKRWENRLDSPIV